MIRQIEQSASLSCPPLALLVEHVAHAERLTHEQREFVVDHIRDCSYCCDFYGILCDLDEAIREDNREAAGLLESSCPSVDLLWRHVLEAETLTYQQQDMVVEHIARCDRCAFLYEMICDTQTALCQTALCNEARRAAGLPEPEIQPPDKVAKDFAETWRRIKADEAARHREASTKMKRKVDNDGPRSN